MGKAKDQCTVSRFDVPVNVNGIETQMEVLVGDGNISFHLYDEMIIAGKTDFLTPMIDAELQRRKEKRVLRRR